MSLTWRIAPEQVGIGFDPLDELSEIIDAVVREGRYRLFTGTENGEAAVGIEHLTDRYREYAPRGLPNALALFIGESNHSAS